MTYVEANTNRDVEKVEVGKEYVMGYDDTNVEKATVTVTLSGADPVKAFRVKDSVRYNEEQGPCVMFPFGAHFIVTPEVIFPSLLAVLDTLFEPPNIVSSPCGCGVDKPCKANESFDWVQEKYWSDMHLPFTCKKNLPHFSERLSVYCEVGWYIGSIQYQYLLHTLVSFDAPDEPVNWWRDDGCVPTAQFDPKKLAMVSDEVYSSATLCSNRYGTKHSQHLTLYLRQQSKRPLTGVSMLLFPYLEQPARDDKYWIKINNNAKGGLEQKLEAVEGGKVWNSNEGWETKTTK